MSNIEEFANMSDVSLIDTDAETLLALAIEAYETEYEEQTGEEINLMPADKARIMLNTMVYAILTGLIASDVEYKQGSLKYATGDALAQIGLTRCSKEKPTGSAAVVTMKYVFDGALATSQVIPKGNRVSKDNFYFATTEDIIVAQGSTYATAICTCTEIGEDANGLDIGTITTHTDALAWVKSVVNIDKSNGGSTVSDDDYTRLIYNTPDGYSVAGPVDAYIAKAKEFSTSIKDVYVETPDDAFTFEYDFDNSGTTSTENLTVDIPNSTIPITGTNVASYSMNLATTELELNFTKPVSRFKMDITRGGIVNVYPLLTDSTIPTQAFLDLLKAYLSGDTIRPLTDKVQTLPPTEQTYTVDFDYYISSDNQITASTIQTQVTQAVEDYIEWQNSKLGQDINPQELIKRVKEAGAKRLDIRTPVYTVVPNTKIAKCSSKSIVYKGLED